METSTITYQQKRKNLIDYLKVKLDQQDLHGIRDVCVDIEILDAVHNAQQGMTQDPNKNKVFRVEKTTARIHKHHLKTLTTKQQEEIKSLYANTTISQRQLGKRFGVTQQTISEVINKR
jgi:DNA-binding transcriptional regulator YiaG